MHRLYLKKITVIAVISVIRDNEDININFIYQLGDLILNNTSSINSPMHLLM